MKREILCKVCAERLRGVDPFKQMTALDAVMMSQEKIIMVNGELRNSATCDFCDKQLPMGETVICRSIISMGRNDYYEWESDYINR